MIWLAVIVAVTCAFQFPCIWMLAQEVKANTNSDYATVGLALAWLVQVLACLSAFAYHQY